MAENLLRLSTFLLVLMVALAASCGEPRDPVPAPTARALYDTYWRELESLEASPHLEADSVRLREDWIGRLESAGVGSARNERCHYLGLAARVASNLHSYTEDRSHAERAHALAWRACAFLKHATRFLQVEAALDVRSSSAWDLSVQEPVIASLRRELEEIEIREIRSALILELAGIFCDRGEDAALLDLVRQEKSRVTPSDLASLENLTVRLEEPDVGDEFAPFIRRASEPLDRALADAKGRWLVLIVTRPGCGACHSRLEAMRKLHAGDPSVSIVHAHVVKAGTPPSTPTDGRLVLTNAEVKKARLDISAVPRIYVLDPEGRIAAKDVSAAESLAVMKRHRVR